MYERAVEFFGEENADEKLFLAFGKFEENCKEVYNSNCNNVVILKRKMKKSQKLNDKKRCQIGISQLIHHSWQHLQETHQLISVHINCVSRLIDLHVRILRRFETISLGKHCCNA